jgi:hypothetical protein
MWKLGTISLLSFCVLIFGSPRALIASGGRLPLNGKICGVNDWQIFVWQRPPILFPVTETPVFIGLFVRMGAGCVYSGRVRHVGLFRRKRFVLLL